MGQTGGAAFAGHHAGDRGLDLSTTLTDAHFGLFTFRNCHSVTRFLLTSQLLYASGVKASSAAQGDSRPSRPHAHGPALRS